MKLLRYLNEATYPIDKKDIERIYAIIEPQVIRVLKLAKSKNFETDKVKFFDYISKLKHFPKLDLYVVGELFSKEFVSPILKAAHKEKPIKIFVGFGTHSTYMPTISAIRVGILRQFLASPQTIRKEVKEVSIKSTIRHELTHWIDDAFHGQIYKIFSDPELAAGWESLGTKAYMTNVELNALMATVIELKRKYGYKWDDMTFEQMIKLKPGLERIYKAIGKNWKVLMLKRMSREGLVGRNMR